MTTALELDRFVEALYGGKLLQPASRAKILAPAEGFAYGWARGERLGRKQMRSAGRSPGYNASVERYLDDGTTVIVLTNSYSPVGQDSVFLAGINAAVFGTGAGAARVAAGGGETGIIGRAGGPVSDAARVLRARCHPGAGGSRERSGGGLVQRGPQYDLPGGTGAVSGPELLGRGEL